MKAILISRSGGPEVLTLGEVPDPVVGPHEVLIDVVAAGLNRADVGQRQGTYPPPPGSPDWPGMEVSGTIAALGADVPRRGDGAAGAAGPARSADAAGSTRADDHGWAIGDEVCALLPGGGYAERVTVDAGLVLERPELSERRDGSAEQHAGGSFALVEAAGLPEAAVTVWSNVFMLGHLQPGETLLVHGGTSGIGSMAIQVAVALGSRVITTVGSAAKVMFAESLGASALNYHDDDFVEVVKRETDGRGADVILDLVGGDYLARNISALAMGGRIMVIANQSGEASTFALGSLMAKRASVMGTTIRARPLSEKIAIVRGVRENIWPLVAAGSVRPIIDRVLPLAEAAKAHRLMEDGGHVGKILLRVDR